MSTFRVQSDGGILGRLGDGFKHLVKTSFRAVGLDIRRVEESPPLPLCDDPVEAIHRRASHDFVAFNCPVSQMVEFNGMSFAKDGWHPLVEAAIEHVESGVQEYEGSFLEKYFATWQPRNAREALLAGSAPPEALERFPSYLRPLPWRLETLEENAAFMARVIEIENASFGAPGLPPSHGYGLHGPVSLDKGRLEYRRLVALVDSISKRGYSRSGGDVTIRVLSRGKDFRFLVRHGHHRVAALVALGHEFVPVVPAELVDARYAAHWPGVYWGIWTLAEALAYLDHLFDFDSLRWARSLSLPSRRESAPSHAR